MLVGNSWVMPARQIKKSSRAVLVGPIPKARCSRWMRRLLISPRRMGLSWLTFMRRGVDSQSSSYTHFRAELTLEAARSFDLVSWELRSRLSVLTPSLRAAR